MALKVHNSGNGARPPRLRRAGWTLVLRVVAPLLLAVLFDWALLAVTGFSEGRRIPLRNLLLPPFILLVVWNAGVTIGAALLDRRSRQTREVQHGL